MLGDLSDEETNESEGLKASLVVAENKNFHSLSPNQKAAIDSWIKNINHIAIKKPHRTLESLIVKKRSDNPADNGKLVHEISPSLVQLSAFILRNYLKEQKVDFDFDEIHAFMQSVFVDIVKKLGDLVEEQKQIKS